LQQTVLDLGCGTGQPALLEAQRVAPGGRVIALDVLPEMIAVASKRAVAMNLTNVEFRQCDIELIPFPDAAFDAATSRFCLMFLRSVEKSIGEVFRVLKPDSGFCASVWAAPEKNPLPRGVLSAYYSLPSPDRSVPGPFRFSEKGSLKELLENAGFVDVTEREVE
jgi:ubiquinone/menaquinone biosynthesis C-methylase UbiE